MKNIKVLVACECSGRVKTAFRERGFDAWSCDLKPSEIPDDKYHLEGDIQEVLRNIPEWDLMIAHPDCQYLASSGLHWNSRIPGRHQKTNEAIEFVKWLLSVPIPCIALENPIGCISTKIRKPDQIIQPYQFGEDASKATCLWLKGLPKLQPTEYVLPHWRCECGYQFKNTIYGRFCPDCHKNSYGKWVWANQTPSGQNKLSPSDHRKADRARTYQGIANAMADQWGDYLMKAVVSP